MKVEAHITRTAPIFGYICDVDKNNKAIAEAEEYDWRLISPGYYICKHDEIAYVLSEYRGRIACSCGDMKYRCQGSEVCKHIIAFLKLKNLPSKPIDQDMEQLLKAAGWIGKKLHPPATPKKEKLPPIKDPERKPQPQAERRAVSHQSYEGKTAEQIVKEMPLKELRRNARKGGIAAIAELQRRKEV